MEESKIVARTINAQGKKRNKTWEENHAAIIDAYVRLIAKLKRAPKITEIRRELVRKPEGGEQKLVKSLGAEIISQHLADLYFEPSTNPLRILTDRVIIAVASAAIKGNAASQKLWFQLMEGWREGMDFTTAGGAMTESKYDLTQLSVEDLVTWRQLMAKTSPKQIEDVTPDND